MHSSQNFNYPNLNPPPMKTSKDHYEEYIEKIGSSTINLRKLYDDAFEKGKSESQEEIV